MRNKDLRAENPPEVSALFSAPEITEANLNAAIEAISAIVAPDIDDPEIDRVEEMVLFLRSLQLEGNSIRQVIRESLIVEMPWPEWTRAEGYWPDHTQAAIRLIDFGQNLSETEVRLIRGLSGRLFYARQFFDAGVCLNPETNQSILSEIAQNGSYPETAIACVHPAFPREQLEAMIAQFDEDPYWLQMTIARRDGKWPDWQDPFQVLTGQAQRSEAFWICVLSTPINGTRCRLAEWDEKGEVDPELYQGELDDLSKMMDGNPDLAELVRTSGWPPGIDLL